jgi:hypothetical protein
MFGIRRAEAVEHEIRSENMDARAFRQAEKGHYGRAAALETRSDMQRVEAVAVAPHPMAFAAATHHPAPYYGPPMAGAVVATDMAMHHAAREAAVAGAVVGAEVAAANRQAEIAYEASRNPYYYGAAPPGAYVQPIPPPAPGYGYPPGQYPAPGYPAYRPY